MHIASFSVIPVVFFTTSFISHPLFLILSFTHILHASLFMCAVRSVQSPPSLPCNLSIHLPFPPLVILLLSTVLLLFCCSSFLLLCQSPSLPPLSSPFNTCIIDSPQHLTTVRCINFSNPPNLYRHTHYSLPSHQ